MNLIVILLTYKKQNGKIYHIETEVVMVTKERNARVLSSFYVSDFHLEMIILPYIIKKMEKENEVIVLTEKKLEKSIKVLISKLNIKKEKKEKILKIDWNNKVLNKDDYINENVNSKKVFIIVGNKKYIEEKNKELEFENIEIVNCYDLEEVQEEILDIKNNSDKILNIKGEE